MKVLISFFKTSTKTRLAIGVVSSTNGLNQWIDEQQGEFSGSLVEGIFKYNEKSIIFSSI